MRLPEKVGYDTDSFETKEDGKELQQNGSLPLLMSTNRQPLVR
jgi:hypothetical protein